LFIDKVWGTMPTTRLRLSSACPGIVKVYFSEGPLRPLAPFCFFLFDPIYVVYRGFSFLFLSIDMIQQILQINKHYVFASYQAMLDRSRHPDRPTDSQVFGTLQEECPELFEDASNSFFLDVRSTVLSSNTINSKNRARVSMSDFKRTVVSPSLCEKNSEKCLNSGGEEFVSHKKAAPKVSEEFTALKKGKKRKSHKVKDVVQDTDQFVATVHTKKVSVSGKEIIEFVRAYEKKIQDYNNKPFYKLMTNGILSKKRKTFGKYVIGTAICKHYDFDIRRFIEAQFFYHDTWKGTAPSLSYSMSLNSTWNSVGRYKSYCERFKGQLNYFDDGVDNIEQAYRTNKKEVKIDQPSEQMVGIYEEMIQHQMKVTQLSRKQVLWVLGHPHKGYIPWQYLRSLPLYQELVEEEAWGAGGEHTGFYRKIKSYRE